jgi:hypothetical protein
VVLPAVATGYSGANFTFTASAIGTPTLNYQWQYNGNNISGANGATLTINNAQPTNAGLYRVIVSNGEGTVTSSVSPLTIITTPPYPTQTLASGPLAYWRLNEMSGPTAIDSVGGFNGTDVGSLVFGVSGPTAPAFPGFESGNTAYQFDGVTTSVTVPALNLNSTNMTITAWVKRSGAQYYTGIVSWNSGGPTIIDLGFATATAGSLTSATTRSITRRPLLCRTVSGPLWRSRSPPATRCFTWPRIRHGLPARSPAPTRRPRSSPTRPLSAMLPTVTPISTAA